MTPHKPRAKRLFSTVVHVYRRLNAPLQRYEESSACDARLYYFSDGSTRLSDDILIDTASIPNRPDLICLRLARRGVQSAISAAVRIKYYKAHQNALEAYQKGNAP